MASIMVNYYTCFSIDTMVKRKKKERKQKDIAKSIDPNIVLSIYATNIKL